MTEKIKELIIKYREIIVYIIVGGLTTLVNWGAFYLLSLVLDSAVPWKLALNNTISWVAAVLFAYPLNRKWVFQSKNPEVFKEFCGFTASRISTWIIEIVIMYVCVDLLKWNQYLSKYLIASVVVIILNYVFSKMLVFRKGQQENDKA